MHVSLRTCKYESGTIFKVKIDLLCTCTFHFYALLFKMLFCDLFSLFLVAYSDSDELAVLLFNVRFACAFGQEHANVQVGADNGAVIGLKTVRVRVLVFCHLVVFLLIF